MLSLLTYFKRRLVGDSGGNSAVMKVDLKDDSPGAALTTIVSPSSTLTPDFEHFSTSLSHFDGRSEEFRREVLMMTPERSRRAKFTFLTPERLKAKFTFMTPVAIKSKNITREDAQNQVEESSSEETFSSYETALPIPESIVTTNNEFHIESPIRESSKIKSSKVEKRKKKKKKKKRERRERKRLERKNCGTPDGLKPRQVKQLRSKMGLLDGPQGPTNMSDLRAQLGLKPKSKNRSQNAPTQEINNVQHVHKKANVSFASPEVTEPSLSYHTASGPLHLGQTVKKSNLSFASSSFSSRHEYSPRLSIDQAKTAVGQLIARNTSLNESGLVRDISTVNASTMTDGGHLRGSNDNRYINLSGVSFLPTEESKKKPISRIKDWGDNDDDGALSVSYQAFEDSFCHLQPQRINQSDFSCSSEEEHEDFINSSPNSKDDWYQYELYKAEQARKEEEQQICNEDWSIYEQYKQEKEGMDYEPNDFFDESSRDMSYSSRHRLFEEQDYRCSYQPRPIGYDFSPVTEELDSKNDHGDSYKPFIVKKGETSIISDISHASATRSEERITNKVIQTALNNSALTGPSPHSKNQNIFDSSVFDNAPQRLTNDYCLTTSGQGNVYKSPTRNTPMKRHEKERMLIQVVRRLKDNLCLVDEIESIMVPIETMTTMHNPLIGTYAEREGILTGYTSNSRNDLLATLFDSLTILDEQKENKMYNSTVDDHLQHTIHFFGALVQSAPDYDDSSSVSWKPKSSLRRTVDSELSSPPHEALNTSMLSNGSQHMRHKSNSQSFGASTISTRENISNSDSTKILTCQTLVIVTTILQKIAIELELLCNDPESIVESEYICRLYLQLMSVPRENLFYLVNGFTFVSEMKSNPNMSMGTHMAQRKCENTFEAEVKELTKMKNALRWDVNFRNNMSSSQILLSSPLRKRHYNHEMAHQNEILPAPEHFPTIIDIPKNESNFHNRFASADAKVKLNRSI